MATEPSEAATTQPEQIEGGPEQGQFPEITADRIVEKLQQDRDGALLVNSAVQQCIIEDQQKMIRELKKALVAKNNPDAAASGN